MRKLFIILTLCCTTFSLAWAAEWKGDGLSSSPYLIQSNADLVKLAQMVNEGNTFEGVSFRLENDLDLASVCGDSLGDWPSIGSIDAYFEGHFDGNGHAITHLYIQSRGTTYKGLFGYIGFHGEVSNLLVEGSVYASYWAGIVAGASSGTIRSCENIGGDVEAYQYAGGIVGGNFGIVSKCQNWATVESSLATGGICGYNYGGLYESDNLGEIYGYNGAGGLTGYNGGFSSFTNCYNAPMGIVQNCANMAFVSGRRKVGGIAGRNDGLLFNDYNRGELSGNTEVGGLAGYNGGFDGVDGLLYNSYNMGDISCSISQAGGAVGVNNSSGDIFNVYNSGEVWVPSEGGALAAVNEGNVSHCYVVGDTCDMVASDKGSMADCRVFSTKDLLQLTDQLNQWVETSCDSSFSHWKCSDESGLPYFSEVVSSLHNVIVYNFHGVIEEDLLIFSEGKEVTLNVLPDSDYVLVGVEAFVGTDSVYVEVDGNRLKFRMPNGDVRLYPQWKYIGEPFYTSLASSLSYNSLSVRGGKGELFLKATEDLDVRVCTINGQVMRCFYMIGGEHKNINMPAGVYIVNGVETLVR